jgi:hypothetical protein
MDYIVSEIRNFISTSDELFYKKYASILASKTVDSKLSLGPEGNAAIASKIRGFAGLPTLKPQASATPAGNGPPAGTGGRRRKTRKHRSRKHKKTRKH